jgi:hypothetical protein
VDEPSAEKMAPTVVKHKGNAWSRGSSAIINAAAQSSVSKAPASIALAAVRVRDSTAKPDEGGGKKQSSSATASPAPAPSSAPATEVISSAPAKVPSSPVRKADLKRSEQPVASQSQQAGTSFSLGKYGSSSGVSDGDEGFFFGFGDTIGDAATWSAPSSTAGGWGDVVGAGDGADGSKQEMNVVASSSVAKEEEKTAGVAIFFEKESAEGLESSESKKSKDVNGKSSVTSAPPGLASAPNPSKMLSVEELEAENEASTDSQSAAPSQGSVGPPPSTEPQASAAVPVVPRSAPTAPPTVPAQPPYHYAHPGGGLVATGTMVSTRGRGKSSLIEARIIAVWEVFNRAILGIQQ